MSNTAPTLSKPAAIRRFRYAIQAFALLFAATAVCVFAVILGDRFPKRFDATATREHQLSPRTVELLKSLQGEYELVVAANFSTLDQTAARRTQDVLDNFSRTSLSIRTTVIDVSSSRGLADLDGLLGRLVERFKPELQTQKKGLASAMAIAGPLSDALSALSSDLLATKDTVRDGDPSADSLRRFFADSAAACRIAGEEIVTGEKAATESVAKTIGRTAVPATDDAIAQMRRPLSKALAELGQVGDNIDAAVKNTDDKVLATATRERMKAPGVGAARLRKEIGDTLTALDELPRTPLSSVVRVLEKSSAAIVIAPPRPPTAVGQGAARPGVTSIELSSIYPPKSDDGSMVQQIDLRARTEDLFAGAVQSLARANAPIVVFVHGRGIRMSPEYLPVASIVDRMRLRGVDFAEWAAGLDSEPPSLRTIDPGAKRPVAYIVISMAPGDAADAARYGKLVDGANKLVAQGKSVLLCEVPSSLPSIGSKDIMAEVLTPLGLHVDTGRPLLQQFSGPRGRVVSPDLMLTEPGPDHLISKAIRGLPLVLPWAVPLRFADGAPGINAVVRIDNTGKTIWAESEFQSFAQMPRNQQPLAINPPAPDSSRDDPAGPWPVVVTIERSLNNTPQRLIVVGCNGWMSGDVMGAEREVESRRVPAYPGNIELLDASVSWLANQDAMISASPQSQQLPLIPPLTEAQLGAFRWALIGGLPVLILLIGAIWRLVRG